MFRHRLAVYATAITLGLSHTAFAQDYAEVYELAPQAAQFPAPSPATTETQAAPFPPAFAMPSAVASAVAAAFEGIVSYYGNEFAGRKTANGERFDPNLLTMAHRTLPFGTLVRITNLANNKSVVARVNDRGPFTGGRVGDLSTAAAAVIDMVRAGVTRARLEVLGPAPAAR